MQPVLFPDPVKVVLSRLRVALPLYGWNDVTSAARVPNPRGARLVIVRPTGGTQETIVTDTPQLTVECWAEDDANAADLAQYCRAIIKAMRGMVEIGVTVYRIDDVATPVPLPDPESDYPRYVFTVLISFRGQALN